MSIIVGDENINSVIVITKDLPNTCVVMTRDNEAPKVQKIRI